jgi:hypothetical protein
MALLRVRTVFACAPGYLRVRAWMEVFSLAVARKDPGATLPGSDRTDREPGLSRGIVVT